MIITRSATLDRSQCEWGQWNEGSYSVTCGVGTRTKTRILRPNNDITLTSNKTLWSKNLELCDFDNKNLNRRRKQDKFFLRFIKIFGNINADDIT